MPRAKKTIGGAPGQKVEAIQGQTYGMGVQQEDLQRAMPAPNESVQTQPAPTDSTGNPPEQATPVRPGLSFQEAMQRVQGAGGVLSAPDDNPSIPITDGLSTGPGRGPEALNNASALGNTLRRLALQTGDPVFNELVSKVRF